MDAERAYTVSEVTREIKVLVEEGFPHVWVEGEISNFVRHSSGHRYFTLKDEGAQLRCVLWKWQGGLTFSPEDGMHVCARGRLSVYERGGQYQLVVTQLRPMGIGELQQAFERLKAQLAAEGLFEEARKRPLPFFPQRVGVVTSPTGAVLRDIAHVLGRRLPCVKVVLWPVRVQGEGAAEEIAYGMDRMNAYGEVDVLIVGRGGGSLEDLWAFNEEVVARAIYRSRIPVISAVGHEVDFTISDFVADYRAPTPSAAAEVVAPDREALLRTVTDLRMRATEAIDRKIQEGIRRVSDLRRSYVFRRMEDRVAEHWQRMDELESRLGRALDHLVMGKRARLQEAVGRLEGLSPLSALSRGFSVCRKMPQGGVVRNSAELSVGDEVEVTFSRGWARCQVEETAGKDE